jgi:hypothetical protein
MDEPIDPNDKLAAASDGSIIACSDGVAWKQAH